MTTDRELVTAVIAGEDGAFQRLVQRHQALCWHIVHRLVGDAEDARDLCQEVFLRVHQRLPQFRFESGLHTWIGRIAYSIALRHLEQRAPGGHAITGEEADAVLHMQPSAENVERSAGERQLHAVVRAHIAQLPPVQRMLLTLYHIDEMTIPRNRPDDRPADRNHQGVPGPRATTPARATRTAARRRAMTGSRPPPEDVALEQEWVLQEQILRTLKDDRAAAHAREPYAALFAILSEMDDPAPPGFAHEAAQLAQRHARGRAELAAFRRLLLGILALALLAIAAGGLVFLERAQLASVAAHLGERGALYWLLVLGVLGSATTGLSRWLRARHVGTKGVTSG